MENLDVNEIILTDLKKISTNGGNVLHYLKSTDEGFNKFGEVYFSWINKNSIKAWKKHTKMTLNLVVPLGKVKFVFQKPRDWKPMVFICPETMYKYNCWGWQRPKQFCLVKYNFLFANITRLLPQTKIN